MGISAIAGIARSVRHSVFGLVAVLALALALTLAPDSAQAQSGGKTYAIDHAVDDCVSRKSRVAALAYSRLGIAACVLEKTKSRAKHIAERNCQNEVPRKWRKSAPCEVITVDGNVVNAEFLARMRKDISVPIRLIVFDGDTNTKQDIDARFVIHGAASKDVVLFNITNDGGAALCSGSYQMLRAKIILNIRCFQNYRFADERLKLKGFVLQNGVYAPVFDAKLKYNRSYIEIVPPEPS